jgi:hypothetical protein
MLAAVLVTAVSTSAAQAQKQKVSKYGVWVLNTIFVSEFQGNALVKGGVPGPSILFGVRGLLTPAGIAWDNEKNLWLSFNYPDMGEIVRLTPRQVGILASGGGVKDVILLQDSKSSHPFVDPTQIEFDQEGDLWVLDADLLEFTPDEIAASGAPTPAVEIGEGIFVEPYRMRFDSSDNLWVEWPNLGKVTGVDEVVRFSPSDRAMSGPPNPSLILDLAASIGVSDFAFDGGGNLWIAAENQVTPAEEIDELIMIPADQIAGSGEIAASPAITIQLPEFTQSVLVDDLSIDFDPVGALWVAGTGTSPKLNQVDKFTPEQLTASGSATSTVRLRENRSETNFRAPHSIRVGPRVP